MKAYFSSAFVSEWDTDKELLRSTMAELEYEIISGLTKGMSMVNLVKFREFINQWQK